MGVPATAGSKGEEFAQRLSSLLVIPAKAGIHSGTCAMDSRLRGNDKAWELGGRALRRNDVASAT